MKTEKLNTVLVSVHSELTNHILVHGPDVPFNKTEYDIYRLLIFSGFSRDITLTSQCGHSNNFHANYTNYETTEEQNELQDFEPTAFAGKFDPCEICGQLWHPTHKCWCRGDKWKPLWIRQNAEKYNATHPDEKPDPEYIKAPRPPCQANTKNYKKKGNNGQYKTNQTNTSDFQQDSDSNQTSTETKEKEKINDFSPHTSAGVFITSAGKINKDDNLDSVARILKETHPQASNAEIVSFHQPTLNCNKSGVINVSEEDIEKLYNISDSSFTEL